MQARYIVASSASSFVVVPLIYQNKVPTETFLGQFVPPEDLTLRALTETDPGSMTHVLGHLDGADYVRKCYIIVLCCHNKGSMHASRGSDSVGVRCDRAGEHVACGEPPGWCVFIDQPPLKVIICLLHILGTASLDSSQ